MKNGRSLLFTASAGLFSLVPLLVQAQAAGLVPQTDKPGLCDIGKLVQNIIGYAVDFSIPLAAVLIGYAGFLYFTSAANPGNVAKAKGIFATALIGFLVAITGWLIVNTILFALFSGGPYFSPGEWFKIQCQTAPRLGVNKPVTIENWLGQAPQGGGGLTPSSFSYSPPPGFTCDVGGLGCTSNDDPGVGIASGNILEATAAYQNADTSAGPNCSGGTGGQCACAWAVNNILRSANVEPLDGNLVSGMETAINNGRGTLVADTYTSNGLSNISQGDIVVWDSPNKAAQHVGIVTGFDSNNQPIVSSNSSTNASFSSRTNLNFNTNWQARVYRLNN